MYVLVALFFFAEFGRSHLRAAHGGLVSGLWRVLCAIMHPCDGNATNRSALIGQAGCMAISFELKSAVVPILFHTATQATASVTKVTTTRSAATMVETAASALVKENLASPLRA